MVVIDVSSSTLGFSSMIAKSLARARDDPSQRAGLVLASQSAYVALPPETPGSALRGWQRMIELHQRAEPQARRPGEARPHAAPEPRSRRLPLGRRLHGRHAALDRAGARACRRCGRRGPATGRSSSSATSATRRTTFRASGCRSTRMRELGIKLRTSSPSGRPRDQPEGVLGLRRLRLHHGRRRRRLCTRARCAIPCDAPLRAATRRCSASPWQHCSPLSSRFSRCVGARAPERAHEPAPRAEARARTAPARACARSRAPRPRHGRRGERASASGRPCGSADSSRRRPARPA